MKNTDNSKKQIEKLSDKATEKVAGGFPGDIHKLIDKDGKVLFTGNDDDLRDLDKRPEFAKAVKVRFRDSSGLTFSYSTDLAKLKCSAERKESLSEEERKRYEDFIIKGVGVTWGS